MLRSARPEEELTQLDTLLSRYETEYDSFRLWGGLSLLAAGAATLPAGLVIRSHTRSALGPFVIGMGAGELAGGAVSLLGLGDADFADSRRLINEERRSGKGSAEIVSTVMADIRKKSERARSRRQISGALGVGVGALGIGLGTALTAAHVSGLSQSERYGYGATFLGIGGVSLIFGLRQLFFEEPIEVVSRTRASLQARTSRLTVADVGFVSVHGGGVLQVFGDF